MRMIWLSITILILGLVISAQTGSNLMAESVDLTNGKMCGSVKDPKFSILSGTIVKRDFADDEMTLSGIVLKQAKDQRIFVNFDGEYLSQETGSLSAQISDLMAIGRRVKLKVEVCGRIFVVQRIVPIKK